MVVTATDTCGNSSSQTVRFAIDKAPPVVTVAGVPQDCANADVTPAFSATDPRLDRVTATLNGAPFASGTVVSAAGDYTLVVMATDTCGNNSSRTVRFTIASPCELYPIALHSSTLAGVQPGAALPDVFNGSQPGNFGWLTWTGASSVPSLVDSLTPPGNSGAYTNPNDSSDHIVSVGDQVQGRPGVENASEVRDALDTLKTRDIVVPVWDNATESGSNTLYRVVGFARIRILDYRLPGENRITARFLGLARCGGLSPSDVGSSRAEE